MRSPLSFARHPVARVGIAVTTGSGLLFVCLLVVDLAGGLTNPYAGLFIFLALPVVFVIGLVLIPLGVWLDRTHRRYAPEWPRIDLNNPDQRRVLWFIVAATLVNLVILSVGTVGGVEYMETQSFCGQVCHEVMEPQFTAHQSGPHARVACVGCHIGPGAGSWVQAKVRGMGQLMSVVTGSFDRPIRLPVNAPRPTREMCTQCHWPERFIGDQVKVVPGYDDDEENSELLTTVRLHVGGRSPGLDTAHGIHWHADPATRVEYMTTEEGADSIPYVKVIDRDGVVTEYVVEGTDRTTIAGGTPVRMDCLGCHSRPAHPFATSPEQVVDRALADRWISRSLPYVRREVVRALGGDHSAATDAQDGIATELRGFYDREYPGLTAADRQAVEQAITVAQDLYTRNVLPRMQVDWGTYQDYGGHTASAGCFRCHDDRHVAGDGSVIRQDCALCHSFE